MNTQRNKIVWVVIPILFIIIFVVALVLIYRKKEVEQPADNRTAEQKLLDSMSSSEPSGVGVEEEKALQTKMNASDQSSLTEEQRTMLIRRMSGS